MPATADQLQQTVALVAHDLTATLGWDRRRATAFAEPIARLHGEFWEPGREPFAARVIDDVQQRLHEGFLDTTWPTCPLHPWHPLWLDEDADPPVWACVTERTRIAPLGSLPDTRPR